MVLVSTKNVRSLFRLYNQRLVHLRDRTEYVLSYIRTNSLGEDEIKIELSKLDDMDGEVEYIYEAILVLNELRDSI